MKRHRSLEEKLAVIKLVEQGQSARSVSDKLHLGRHIVYEWLAAYKDRGIQGLMPKSKRGNRLSYEEKCNIIREYKESELTLYQLSVKHGKSGTVLVIQEQQGLVLVSLHKRVVQFVSPLVVIPLSHNLFGADLTAPYKVAILLCLVFLVQVWATRHFQSLPPK